MRSGTRLRWSGRSGCQYGIGCHELLRPAGRDRKLLTLPADPAESSKLAGHYHNDALGDLDVRRAAGRTTFDFGEWRSEVATRKNPDGSISFITTDAGLVGFEFVVGKGPEKKLTIRDAQHEYILNGS